MTEAAVILLHPGSAASAKLCQFLFFNFHIRFIANHFFTALWKDDGGKDDDRANDHSWENMFLQDDY